ncbi:hypothetical protein NQZ68_009354 [Dissostichus eleginoides]|nr:hypothetical protein NQZ68_009354 [Dissostichus eleginoides]
MSDSEWVSRLRKFASTGVWPAGEGNRPAPRQKKRFELYQRIEKCPMQAHGQKSLFGQVRQCTCGFHPQKVPWDSRVLHLVRSTELWGSRVQQVLSKALWDTSRLQQTAAEGHLRTPLNLSMTHVTDPTEASTSTYPTERSFSTAPSVAVSAAQPQTASMPVLSPGAVSATVSAAASRTDTDIASPVQLPRLWSEGFPPEDHKWILKSLLKLGHKGKLELQDHLKLVGFKHPSVVEGSSPLRAVRLMSGLL